MSAVGCPPWGSLSLFLMESMVGEVWSSSRDGSNFLGLPGLCPWDDDDEPLGLEGIKPKSSPIPRRRSSASSCSDDDSQPPPSSSRRVSFADAFGLSLVSVKQFDSWTMCGPSDTLEGDLNETKVYFLSQLFTLPARPEELIHRVKEQKLELESLELLPGTTTLKGVIRVLNLCFDKLVYIRTSLDCWNSHFDLLAEYIPGSSAGDTDCFSFRLTLVPPFGEQGARVDFCLRYETPFGNFWANNSGQNYILFCHEKAKDQGEDEKIKRKSCLKSTSYDYSSESSSTSNTEEVPGITLNCEVAAVIEAVAVKEEKMQMEPIKLQQENIRNHSKRSRRKAARLEKIHQYFAKRDEKGHQQIEQDTDEAAVMNVKKSVSERVESPIHFSTLQTNVCTKMLSPSPSDPERIKRQKCLSGSLDSVSKQVPATQIQTQEKKNIPVTFSELTTSISQGALSPVDSVTCHKSTGRSVSQTLDNSENKKTLTGNTISVTQQLLECQNSGFSTRKSVEKAWKCFENSTMEKIGSTVDRRMGQDSTSSGHEANHTDNVILENNPDIQSFRHNFTFETIVAPLYHQVFEIMEIEKRELMNREFNNESSAGNFKERSLRAVTYKCYPRTQSVETRPNAWTSEKHVVKDSNHGTCNVLFSPELFNTNKTTENVSSGTNVNTELVKIGSTLHVTTDMADDLLKTNISESKIVTPKHHLASSLSGLQLECLNRACSLEDCIPDQEQPHDRKTIVQSQYLLDRTLEDNHCKTLHNACFKSECSSDSLQRGPVDYMVLSTQSDLESISANIPPSIVSKNPSFTDSTEINTVQSKEAEVQQPQTPGVTQAPMESAFTEMLPSSKCMEESHRPIPDTSMFCAHISSNVTTNFSQSEIPTPLQNLNPIQNPSPGLGSFKHSQKTGGITLVQFQITEGTNLTQGSDNMPHHTDSDFHVSEMESNSGTNNETDGFGRIDVIPNERNLDRILQNPLHVSQINKNKEFRLLNFRFPDCFNGPLDEDKRKALIYSKNNPYTVSAEKKTDICKEDNWVENFDVNEEQESFDNDHQTAQVSDEIVETKETKEFEEEEEQKLQQEQGQEGPGREGPGQEGPVQERPAQEVQGQEGHDGQEGQQEEEVNKEIEEDQKQAAQEQEGPGGLHQQQQDTVDKEKQEEREQVKENLEEKEETKRQEQKQEELEEELEEEQENDYTFQDELLYIDDEEDEAEKEVRENAVGTEEQKSVSRVSSVAKAECINDVGSFKSQVHLHVSQEKQSTGRISKGCSISAEAEISWDTNLQALTGNHDTVLSDRIELIQPCQKKKQAEEDTTGEVNISLESPEDISEQGEKNTDDSASTESLTDDELELYVHRLKCTQDSKFKDTAFNGTCGKRPSVSRMRTIPSPMPSISESVNEDQPNASLEDLINKKMTELENAKFSLIEEEEEVIGCNVLWWREFFSSGSMYKIMAYTFLFVVFLVTAYFYDFIACFGLYLLALYWLYFQGESEPTKVIQAKT